MGVTCCRFGSEPEQNGGAPIRAALGDLSVKPKLLELLQFRLQPDPGHRDGGQSSQRGNKCLHDRFPSMQASRSKTIREGGRTVTPGDTRVTAFARVP
jgi:hypothetical protein